MSVVALRGCAVQPMAGYLKALAVLRLVSEQADSEARGWWSGNVFHIDSKLDEAGVRQFFLQRYAPTPIVAPWNGGSGFGEGDRRDGMDAILGTSDARFSVYQATIREVLGWPETGTGELTVGGMIDELERAAAARSGKAKNEILELVSDYLEAAGDRNAELRPLTVEQVKSVAKAASRAVTKLRTAVKKVKRAGGKDLMVRLCRNRLPDPAQQWVDAAVVLRTTTELAYPPIAGTGGSEGRLDYTNSFMERVSDLLLRNERSDELLGNALFGYPTSALEIASTGQLDPGCAGGFNQGPGIETKDFPTNAWSFVLALEGTVAWAGSAGRRHGGARQGIASSPFTVRGRAVGYGTAESIDESDARAEVWMPVWPRPCGYAELRCMLREGRVEWEGRPVNDAVEFTKAVASLGSDRGIESFQRYSLIKRRGDSYLALPAGRVPASERVDGGLWRDADVILQRFDQFARGFPNGLPARLDTARRAVDEAAYEFAVRSDSGRPTEIFARIGALERTLASRNPRTEPKLTAPLFGLSPRWFDSADDGSLEFRVAAAVASIRRNGDVGPLRANLIAIDPAKPWAWDRGEGQTAWKGITVWHRLHSVLRRRVMDSGRLSCDGLALAGALSVCPADAAAMVGGPFDEGRFEDFLFAATLVNFGHQEFDATRRELNRRWRDSLARSPVPRDYALLKHLFEPSLPVRPEASIVSLLAANDIEGACAIAIRRLRASEMLPLRVAYPGHDGGLRVAAALLVPVYPIGDLSRLVLREKDPEKEVR